MTPAIVYPVSNVHFIGNAPKAPDIAVVPSTAQTQQLKEKLLACQSDPTRSRHAIPHQVLTPKVCQCHRKKIPCKCGRTCLENRIAHVNKICRHSHATANCTQFTACGFRMSFDFTCFRSQDVWLETQRDFFKKVLILDLTAAHDSSRKVTQLHLVHLVTSDDDNVVTWVQTKSWLHVSTHAMSIVSSIGSCGVRLTRPVQVQNVFGMQKLRGWNQLTKEHEGEIFVHATFIQLDVVCERRTCKIFTQLHWTKQFCETKSWTILVCRFQPTDDPKQNWKSNFSQTFPTFKSRTHEDVRFLKKEPQQMNDVILGSARQCSHRVHFPQLLLVFKHLSTERVKNITNHLSAFKQLSARLGYEWTGREFVVTIFFFTNMSGRRIQDFQVKVTILWAPPTLRKKNTPPPAGTTFLLLKAARVRWRMRDRFHTYAN